MVMSTSKGYKRRGSIVNIEKIKELIEIFEESKLGKLHLREEEFSILLEKEGHSASLSHYTSVSPSAHHPLSSPTVAGEEGGAQQPTVSMSEGETIASPMVGTFYQRPSPDEAPFVKVGDTVTEESIVGIIEAMKVMNEVKAGVKGVIEKILVNDGQPVEFGTNLFYIRPL